MTRVGAEEARKQLADLLRRAGYARERIVISVHGKELAALVSMDDLRALERLEDVLDVVEGEAILARVESGEERTLSLAEADEGIFRRAASTPDKK